MARRVSIDKLAEMVAAGFQEVQEDVRQGFHRVNERMDRRFSGAKSGMTR